MAARFSVASKVRGFFQQCVRYALRSLTSLSLSPFYFLFFSNEILQARVSDLWLTPHHQIQRYVTTLIPARYTGYVWYIKSNINTFLFILDYGPLMTYVVGYIFILFKTSK